MSASFLESLTPQSTLAELPAWARRLPASALGVEVDAAFRHDPELPGVIVEDAARVLGSLSRAQFQQTISRPFGRDVVGPRAIRHLLAEISGGDPLILHGDTPVQEAVRSSLTRSRSMIYEPVLVSSGEQDDIRLIGFTDLLQADSRISFLRNQQMREILATIQEGFLLVERDHRIAAEYSRSVESILDVSGLAGAPLPEVLGEILGGEIRELAHGYLETLFNSNVIERLVTDINPLKSAVVARNGRGPQHLSFSFRRSMEGRLIRRILVRVEDRTREVRLAAELEEQEQLASRRVALTMELTQADPEPLTDFLTRFLAEIDHIRRLRARSADPASADAIFRLLHGLKGEAGMLALRSFADRLHHAEDEAGALRDSAAGSRGFERLDAALAQLRAIGTEASDLIARLSALGSRSLRPETANPARRGDGLISALERLIGDLATRLARPARLVAYWPDGELPAEYRAVVRTALIQLARNSMVHGIEATETRRVLGKPVPAVLQVALRRHEPEEQFEVIFQDDGGGVDLERVRARARERLHREIPDDDEATQLIFEPGFSTAKVVNGDAGRGVGLDLVKTELEKLGGTIFVHSRPPRFCAFQILLPLRPGARTA